jgi:virginiamycin B lyase
VRFDPKTEKFQTWLVPSGGGVVRMLNFTKDGKSLWFSCSGVDSIAKLEIKN